MAVTARKSLLFLGGGAIAAAVVAYFAGAFYPQLSGQPDPAATAPEAALGQDAADSKDARLPGADAQESAAAPDQPAEAGQPPSVEAQVEAPAEQSAEAHAEAPAETPAQGVLAPSFDVVRVEPNGSIVIAGKALPNARVDLLVGSSVIGSATAGPEGDFAVVLDEPLKPGDYQIVLRATAPDNVVAMSVETAVVSVPDTPDGQVLALVEEPGKPSQMITMPQPRQPAESVAQAGEEPQAQETPAGEAAAPAASGDAAAGAGQTPPADTQAALAPQTEQTPAPAQPPAQDAPAVRVEAVEIDGRKVFVAGVAEPGRTVRGYANEILLGDAKASPDGRFLIEADRDLPVGDYIIRVDALEPDGVKVAARAAVPFEREPGETIAAVAAPEPVAPAAVAADGSAEPPAEAKPGPEPKTEQPAAETQANEQPAAPATEPALAEAPPAGEAEKPAAPQTAGSAAPLPEAVAEAPAPSASTPSASTPSAPAGAPAAEETQPPASVASAESQAAQEPAASAPAPAQPAAPAVASGEQPAADTEPQAPVAEAPVAQAPAPEAPALASPAPEAPAPEASAPEAPAPEAPAPEAPASVAEAQPAPTPSGEAPVTQQPAVAAPEEDAGEPGAAPEADVAAAPAQDLPTPPSADGVTEVLAPKLQPAGSAVIIRRGDTLWRISRRVYGRGVRYSTIYLANEDQIEDPDRIWPGQVFKVPEKSNDGKAEADFSTMGDRLTTMPAEGGGAAEPVQQ